MAQFRLELGRFGHLAGPEACGPPEILGFCSLVIPVPRLADIFGSATESSVKEHLGASSVTLGRGPRGTAGEGVGVRPTRRNLLRPHIYLV